MQPEHQVLLPDNAHSAATQSPSVTYPIATKKPVPEKKKDNDKLGKWRILVNFLLFLITIADVVLFTFVIINLTKLQLKPKIEWVQSHEPQSYTMRNADFLISSTSETCNELVREYLLVKDDRIDSLDIAYVFMIFCLDNAEPHRSSQAGNNVLLKTDAKNGKCHTIDGFGEERTLKTFLPFIEVHKEAEYNGGKSIHDPAAFRVVEDFVHKNGNRGKKIELSNLGFPMTKQLHAVISQGNIENSLLFQSTNSFQFLFHQNYDKSLAVEGELMNSQHVSWALDKSGKMVVDRVWKYGNSGFKDKTLSLQRNFALLKSHSRHMKTADLVKIAGTEYSICAMKEPLGMEKKTVATLLNEYKQEESQKGDHIGEEALKDVNIYKRILRLLQKHFPDSKKILKHFSSRNNLSKNYAHDVKHLGAMKNRRSNRLNYEANSFVLVDRTRQTAVAYSSSLGTSFGSFMSLFSPADIGNNMMYGFGKNYENMAEYQYLMNPIIITEGKKIHIAYAGQGGWFSISLDIARRLHSLVFTLFHNVSLVNSLRTPLLFPLAPTGAAKYTSGFPWVHLNPLRSAFNATFVEHISSKAADIVTAIHGDTAIHFDGSDVARLNPHGI